MQFVEDGEERVVVGSLDLNQCLWLPDELTGKRPGVRLLLPFSMLLQNTDDQNIFFDSCDWYCWTCFGHLFVVFLAIKINSLHLTFS
jgi:hypothetical protein